MLKNDFGPKEDPMLGSIVILLVPSKTVNSYFMQFLFQTTHFQGRIIDILIL